MVYNRVRMFLVAVLFIGRVMPVHAQRVAAVAPDAEFSAQRVTVNVENAPLATVLHAIARQAGLTSVFDDALVSPDVRVTLRVHDVPAEQAFQAALRGTGLMATVRAHGDVIIVRRPKNPDAVGLITGKVTDAKTQQPLRSVKISLDGVDRAETGDDGSYRVAGVSAGSHTITIKLIGYMRVVRTVTVRDNIATPLSVALDASATPLDQVVVTGTLIPTEVKTVPSAITVITAKDIEDRGITHIDQFFRGDVPGLFVLSQGAWTPLGQVMMFSRGATAIAPTSTPTGMTNPIKTYVDGVEMADPQFLSRIDPKSIERIEILTGPQASTVYGSGALNGVMQIFTKRGNTSKPQLTASLLSGWVENNFSSSRTPQHDYSAQLAGVEGRVSYNAGGSWLYVGPWSPSIQQTTLSSFGGMRAQFGPFTADASLRLNTFTNRARGDAAQTFTQWQLNGVYRPTVGEGLTMGGPQNSSVSGQTSGLTLTYAPMTWWSHEVILGQDVSNTDSRSAHPGFVTSSDTGLGLSSSGNTRTSLRYMSTVRVPVTSIAQLVVSFGGDGWNSLTNSLYTNGLTSLTGSLSGASISRQPSHNRGAFVQGQFGVQDVLFFTYGLRAEWNPNYGADAQPNYAPRYGMAYTRDMDTPWGPFTAKVRASYGRSTQPPTVSQKQSVSELAYFPAQAAVLAPYYGNSFLVQLESPELGPSFQQGGEGGLELYFAKVASLVVTRYNQTVDGLIAPPIVDSIKSIIPVPAGFSQGAIDAQGYGYWYQTQNLNVGSIRNQGWELQGTITAGPLTTKGTYSWTKSRVIGITPRYRAFLTGSQYQTGLPFNFLPEHTWALNLTYGHAATSVGLDINGIGFLYGADALSLLASSTSSVRIRNDQPRTSLPTTYRPQGPGYATADLNATQRFGSWIDGVFQVTNLTNYYRNEYQATYASLGRQMKVGARIRM